MLAELRELGRRAYVSPDDYAIIYIGLGDRDQAFTWLEKVGGRPFRDGYVNSAWTLVLDPLRSDPRFKKLAQRVIGIDNGARSVKTATTAADSSPSVIKHKSGPKPSVGRTVFGSNCCPSTHAASPIGQARFCRRKTQPSMFAGHIVHVVAARCVRIHDAMGGYLDLTESLGQCPQAPFVLKASDRSMKGCTP